MDRRKFIGGGMAGGLAVAPAAAAPQMSLRGVSEKADVFIERDQPGQPHKGKVLAAIQPHADDIPLFAAGTVAKLIKEGYTGVMIRITNAEMAGRGATTVFASGAVIFDTCGSIFTVSTAAAGEGVAAGGTKTFVSAVGAGFGWVAGGVFMAASSGVATFGVVSFSLKTNAAPPTPINSKPARTNNHARERDG